jgi:tRNA (guanine-N7-)-methyltransferase
VRAVRSYVRREGRITPAQVRALRELSGAYCLPPGPVSLGEAFGRHAPKIAEVGCGRGEVLLHLARCNPGNDYLGIEVYRPAIGHMLNQIAARRLSNVRILCADAVEVFERWGARERLDAVLIFFPDPWPKKRHHKRRLIKAEFLQSLAGVVHRHARIFVATDWADYAEQIAAIVAQSSALRSLGPAPRPRWRPVTSFESRALREGRAIAEFCLARAARPSGPSFADLAEL